jgi:hypothetical protein
MTTPERSLQQARTLPTLAEKVSDLRRFIREYEQDPLSRTARDQLINLLIASQRYNEALSEYRIQLRLRRTPAEPDLKLLELLLKTGRYGELLRLSGTAPANGRDLLYDERLFELRIQAFLAQGHYRQARTALEQWLGMHSQEGLKISRFEPHVRSLQHARRDLLTLERLHGPSGKPLFTASVPDSLQRWSRRRSVPIFFFNLVPTQGLETPLNIANVANVVQDINRGFAYLSSDQFSLSLKQMDTLYVRQEDFDLNDTHATIFSSRLYVHTLAPLYRWAGRAFVVLIDHRPQADGQAAYMGDGIIHIGADKLRSMTLMHEILHGLGATHQEWNIFESQGFTFDRTDRGLMTFDKGELRFLGLEEKNRVLLDWPPVATIRMQSQDLPMKDVLAARAPSPDR